MKSDEGKFILSYRDCNRICMGRKIDVVSFLCNAFTRKKNKPEDPKAEDSDTTAAPPLKGGANPAEKQDLSINPPQTSEEELLNMPLPPPPGRLQPQHLKSASCHQQHSRSNSAISKLSSTLSMKVRTSSRREDGRKNNKNLKHEDSIWKKTIILGEKCRVTDDDNDTVLYDERGNRISTYHPKNNGTGGASVKSFSRQNSGIE